MICDLGSIPTAMSREAMIAGKYTLPRALESFGRILPLSIDDSTLGEVIRREMHGDGVSRQDSDVVLPHSPRDVGENGVIVLESHPKQRVRQRLGYDRLDFDRFFLGQTFSLSSELSQPLKCVTSGTG